MARFVALLRGINVGGNRSIPMARLRELFAAAGAEQVETYIQSGNVVFEHASRSEAKLCASLETAIAQCFGFQVPVMLRSGREFGAIISGNPFADAPSAQLHVSFLPGAPPAGALDAIDVAAFEPDRCALKGREIYLCLPGGVGRSKLIVALGKHKPVAAATTRNWRTVQTLHQIASR